jgi:hypothetical protein
MAIQMSVLKEKHAAIRGCLDEVRLRIWAAAEARSLGHGGIACVAQVTGLSRRTIHRGLQELDRGQVLRALPRLGRVRQVGGGRKTLTVQDPGLLDDLEALVDPTSRADPRSPLRWTCKSTRHLAVELNRKGHRVGQRSVCALLARLEYSLQSTRKTREGSQHPDRDAQFHYLNELVKRFMADGQPVISVDTKKKELVGDFANGGQEWQPQGHPESVRTHDFVDPQLGKVAPYGVYDLAANQGWVSVGIDHDTAEFAVETIRRWWREMGRPLYPRGRRLLITADNGGSNGHRLRLWKLALQRLADQLGLEVWVCHFPPGTSKWNKIEHRMFCHMTQNWRGRPLISQQVVVKLIGSTTTKKGLQIRAAIDTGKYHAGTKVTKEQMKSIRLKSASFHGEWNYTILPNV